MKTASTLAAIVFCVVAFLHLLRLVFGMEIVIAGEVVPMWVSGIGFVVPLGLAIALVREGWK